MFPGWRGLSCQAPLSPIQRGLVLPAVRLFLFMSQERLQCHACLDPASHTCHPFKGLHHSCCYQMLVYLLPVSRDGGPLSVSSLLYFRCQVQRLARSRLSAILCRMNESMNGDLTKDGPLYFPQLRASPEPDTSLWSKTMEAVPIDPKGLSHLDPQQGRAAFIPLEV